MPDQLLQFDRRLFYLVNHGMANSFFDWLMPVIRNPYVWIPLYIFIIGFCVYRYKKTGLYIILMLALTFAVTDRGSAGLIKAMVKRVRPCNDAAMASTIVSRVPCGSGYSFPSAHASNHFAIAFFLSFLFYKRWRWIWAVAILWAASISFAQVYVGVHYPLDVIGGAVFGMATSSIMLWIFRKLNPGFIA